MDDFRSARFLAENPAGLIYNTIVVWNNVLIGAIIEEEGIMKTV